MTTSSQVLKWRLDQLARVHRDALKVKDPGARCQLLSDVALRYLQVARRALNNSLELSKELKEGLT